MQLLADTSFLIDLMANESSAVQRAKELERGGIAILVGSPTIFELFVGAAPVQLYGRFDGQS